MFRKLLIVCLLFKIFNSQEIDLNICPNGLTSLPSDSQWPKIFPNRFEIFAELTTDIETIEIRQIFIGPYRDVIYFRNYQTNLQIYSDFQINEILTINENFICDRSKIESNEEYLPFIASQYVKPSILLGFNGRNNFNEKFSTQYLGKEIIRDGILTKKFQSCFFLEKQNLTFNATYYLTESYSNEINLIQIDINFNNYPYTYNIIQYNSNPSLTITTPSGVFCSNRINTKDFPQNLPTNLFLHAESYSSKHNIINSYDRLIDEKLKFERIDYTDNNILTPSRLLIDYSTNLSYMYTHETQQCLVMNTSNHLMGTINEILFQISSKNQSIQYHYTGLDECGREFVQCHRWIGEYVKDTYIQQYEWYWSGKYNEIDMKELIPIKVNLKTIFKNQLLNPISQEINIFNYNPTPNSIESIDSTLAECYRSLGPIHHYNYAILRFILNNDAKYPIYQYILSLKTDLHIQLSEYLQIRPIRLSSFIIDINNEKNISVTFTLLDNPPGFLNELSSIELIQKLAKEINDGKIFVRVNDGAFDLQARINSLQTLVPYLLSNENQTNYFNETIFIYHNITQTIIKRREKLIERYLGSYIVALWTSFILLSLVVTLALGTFIVIRK